MAYCIDCGQTAAPDQRFCRFCGAELEGSAAREPSLMIADSPTEQQSQPGPANPAFQAIALPVPTRPEPGRSAGSQRRRSWKGRMAAVLLLALTVIMLVGGAYLRYNSTTCQLQRDFAVAGWDCGGNR